MGNSISLETHNRIESLKKRGRFCASHPTCFKPATIKQTLECTDNGQICVMTVCVKHAVSKYANAKIIKEEVF
jgi:hypothetical protein